MAKIIPMELEQACAAREQRRGQDLAWTTPSSSSSSKHQLMQAGYTASKQVFYPAGANNSGKDLWIALSGGSPKRSCTLCQATAEDRLKGNFINTGSQALSKIGQSVNVSWTSHHHTRLNWETHRSQDSIRQAQSSRDGSASLLISVQLSGTPHLLASWLSWSAASVGKIPYRSLRTCHSSQKYFFFPNIYV